MKYIFKIGIIVAMEMDYLWDEKEKNGSYTSESGLLGNGTRHMHNALRQEARGFAQCLRSPLTDRVARANHHGCDHDDDCRRIDNLCHHLHEDAKCSDDGVCQCVPKGE